MLVFQACTALPPEATRVLPSPGEISRSSRATEEIPSPTSTTAKPNETSSLEETPWLPSVLDPEHPLKVAYVKDNDVWFWQEGTQPRLLTDFDDVRDVALSDDGTLIAFSRELDYARWELWVVAVDQSVRKVLVNEKEFADMVRYEDDLTAAPLEIDWVPGDHVIIFNTFIVYQGPGLVRDNELNLVDVETSSLTLLLDQGQGGDFYYSPDGTKIALAQPESISVVNSDGTNRRELLNFKEVITTGEHAYYPNLVWNQDSSAFRAVIPPDYDKSEIPGETKIWNLPIDGSEAYLLSARETLPALFDPTAISPDVLKVAYIKKSVDNPDQNTLLISNVKETEGLIYDSGLISFQDWSPDNSHFIYINYETYIVGEIDSKPKALNIAYPVFQLGFVDDTRYTYLFRHSGTQELWLGSIDGSQILIDRGRGTWMYYDYVK
jgi:hypothetical protein